MGELPFEIYEEILVRLKVKDLIQYKSVCKSWNSLISSDCFVKSHLNYNRKKMLDINEIGDTRIVLSGPSISVGKCDIAGSSNGLVCIRFGSQVLVVNPSTHRLIKLKSLPQIIEYFSCIGIGYDSSIDDYKVVIRARNPCTNKYRFLVLTLRSNVWRSVVGELDYYVMYKGVLCNGVIHSLAFGRYHKPNIVSFDLSKEVFKEIPTPMPLQACDYFSGLYKLGTIKDRLCIFRCSSRTLSNHHELWLMKNYNIKESESIWEQMLSPPPWDDSGHETIMDYLPCPRTSISSHYIPIWMLEEDSDAPVTVQSVKSLNGKAHIFLSTISECNYNYDKHVFVESLVSPHGMGNDNGNSNEGRVIRKIDNVISPDGDGRNVKIKKESFVSQKYDGGRAKRKRRSLVSPDGDKRRVSSKRRQINVTHDGDGNGGDPETKKEWK